MIGVCVLAASAMVLRFPGGWTPGQPAAVMAVLLVAAALAVGVLAAPWCLHELPWPARPEVAESPATRG